MKPSLRLGPAAVRIVGAAAATPSSGIETRALVDELAADIPAARREVLAHFVADELGVGARAFVAKGERAFDLAARAARAALAEAGCPEICVHVHASSTPSRWTGPDAARIGQELGLAAAFFDVRGGCSGGLWALLEGARLAVAAGGPVLVTAADAFSLAFTPGERMLPLAMGDGAGALVLVPDVEGAGGLQGAVFGGAPLHADLGTVAAALPPRGGEAFVLGGDPDRFGEITEAGAHAAVAALAPPPRCLFLVHGRAAVARRVAGASPVWLESLRRHGQLGAASLLVALAELRAAPREEAASSELVLVSAGGGIGFGAARWRLG